VCVCVCAAKKQSSSGKNNQTFKSESKSRGPKTALNAAVLSIFAEIDEQGAVADAKTVRLAFIAHTCQSAEEVVRLLIDIEDIT